MNKENFKKKLIQFHDKNYKKLLIIPAVLLIFCFVYMYSFYSQNHDFFYKDVSLSGGTLITLEEKINSAELINALSTKLENLNVREISDLATGEQKAVIIETTADKEQAKKILEEYLGYELIDGENVSFEFTGSTLSESFYKQLLLALLFSFALMAVSIFVQFKSFIPSLAVILSAFADICMSLVLVNILGIRLSSAGIVSLIMLIGYSVDTDILLTNKVLKREGSSINKKIFEAFKTGIVMTLTSLSAVVIADLIVGQFSSVLHQIFLVMSFGLCFDIFNTWLTNVCIIKWYASKKQK